jgi:hypothetical protein
MYDKIDMGWVDSLMLQKTLFDHPEAQVGPLLLDSGCSTSCSPYLEDFVGELEYGDFG